jgi:hypothetical protein
MKQSLKCFTVAALSIFTMSAFASPTYLVTHNNTNVESNAYIAGTIRSQYPSKPMSENRVFWTAVKLACFGHVVNGQCSALIRMETNTDHPVDLGLLYLDLSSGDITPKEIHANGYTLIVNGPGVTTLTKD